MSDKPFTLMVTRDQVVRAILDLMSDVDMSDDGPGAGHVSDVLLHSLDPAQFPVHPDDAPVAIAAGPTGFTPLYLGSPQYYRDDAPGFILIHDRAADRIRVHGPTDTPSGSVQSHPVVHTVAVIDGDVDDAVAAASAAVDHFMARGR